MGGVSSSRDVRSRFFRRVIFKPLISPKPRALFGTRPLSKRIRVTPAHVSWGDLGPGQCPGGLPGGQGFFALHSLECMAALLALAQGHVPGVSSTQPGFGLALLMGRLPPAGFGPVPAPRFELPWNPCVLDNSSRSVRLVVSFCWSGGSASPAGSAQPSRWS